MRSFFTLFCSLFIILLTTPTPILAQATPEKFSCDIDLGPDLTVCSNAQFVLNPAASATEGYAWTGSPGLSCYDCPSPVLSGLSTGIYIYIATLSIPGVCTQSDKLRVSVINGEAPQ